MDDANLEKWARRAAAEGMRPELTISSVPLHVLLGEAVDVAKFFARRWRTERDGQRVVRLGLESAATAGKGLGPETGDELLELERASQAAQSAWLLTVDPPADFQRERERARFVLGEIEAALEWLFDDGVADEKDAQLASVEQAHAGDPETSDALASALDDFAALAEPHRAALDGVGGFDASLLDEAPTLAAKLREQPSKPDPMGAEARAALARRNQIVNLLVQRVALVRSAARFVFRNEPAIVREVTSAYARRKRAARRGAKAVAKQPATTAG